MQKLLEKLRTREHEHTHNSFKEMKSIIENVPTKKMNKQTQLGKFYHTFHDQ
jgi:hypothetical protein